MTSQLQATKYIERLVRIITQKQKIIDELRRSAKPAGNQHHVQVHDESSMVGRKVREELTLNNLEIKMVSEKMSAMEVKIQEFSQGLKEEIALNQQLRLQMQVYERRQKGLLAQIASLTELNHKLEENLAQIECSYSAVLAKNDTLQSVITELNQKIQSYQATESEEQKFKEEQNLMSSIQNKVQNILKLVNYHPLKENNEIKKFSMAQQHQQQHILTMLEMVEEVLKKQNDCAQSDILNDTLDGLSVIMRSFQDKKEDFQSCASAKKRNNCSAGPILALKESGFITYPKKTAEICCLQKSKIQTTRLNDTSKLIEGFLSQ